MGASPNPLRYSHRAVEMLKANGHPVEAVGLRTGEIDGVAINTDHVQFDDVDTVTLYVGPRNQESWKSYIKSLNPNRVIFNPGAENDEFGDELKSRGIEVEEACTLVLLSMGSY